MPCRAKGSLVRKFDGPAVFAEFRSSHAWDACYTDAQIAGQSVSLIAPESLFLEVRGLFQ
jgi:hypothetical protein